MKIIKLHPETIIDLNIKESGKIIKTLLDGTKRKRFQDLGFIEDTKITLLHKAPSSNPRAYLVKGTVIAIRNEDAEKIFVKRNCHKRYD